MKSFYIFFTPFPTFPSLTSTLWRYRLIVLPQNTTRVFIGRARLWQNAEIWLAVVLKFGIAQDKTWNIRTQVCSLSVARLSLCEGNHVSQNPCYKKKPMEQRDTFSHLLQRTNVLFLEQFDHFATKKLEFIVLIHVLFFGYRYRSAYSNAVKIVLTCTLPKADLPRIDTWSMASLS